MAAGLGAVLSGGFGGTATSIAGPIGGSATVGGDGSCMTEGIAGSAFLSAGGMHYFAAAHTVFFVLLALLYEQFTAPRGN